MSVKLAAAIATDAAIHRAPFPTDKKCLKSFVRACNVYRRFIANFARRARSLTSILRKEAEPYWHSPTTEQQRAFHDLKQALIRPPILSLLKKGMPFIIDTDALQYSMGSTLLQKEFRDLQWQWNTVGYWSKPFSDTESRNSATERECFSVVWVIRTLRPYVEGTTFVVRSDHNAIRFLMNVSDSHGCLIHWRLTLGSFDFTEQY